MATAKTMHVDKILTQMAIGYRPEGMIADMIMPSVPVDKQSDIYQVWDRGRKLRRQNTHRAPGTEARIVDMDVGSDTYFCRNYALKYPVTIEDKANADPAFVQSILNGRTQTIIDDLMLDKEIRVAQLVTTAANVGSSSAVSSAWNGAGDVLGNLNTAIDNVKYSNGVRPNRIAFGDEAWESARKDTTVRDLIKGTNNGGGYATVENMRNLLEVEQILIAGAFQNTGEEGLNEVLQTIWGDNVLVYYAPMTPNKERPSFAYSFEWRQPNLPAAMVVERHAYDTRKKAEEVEAGYYGVEKITGASYGFLLVAVNSST